MEVSAPEEIMQHNCSSLIFCLCVWTFQVCSLVRLRGPAGGFKVLWSELVWTGLNWSELVWTGLNWSELVWTGLNWFELVLMAAGYFGDKQCCWLLFYSLFFCRFFCKSEVSVWGMQDECSCRTSRPRRHVRVSHCVSDSGTPAQSTSSLCQSSGLLL